MSFPTRSGSNAVSRAGAWPVVLAAALAALGGCGGGNSAGNSATTAPAKTMPVTTTASNSGCDAVAQCFPEVARVALERCPPERLDAPGRAARGRLERLLARIADVDLHNEQAYEASDAARAALADFEEHCH